VKLSRATAGTTPARAAEAPACRSCRHFRAAAVDLEAQLPGLRTLSSAFAAVRASDGLCALHDRYLSGAYSCRDFQPAQ
jgi:hypothetical protein